MIKKKNEKGITLDGLAMMVNGGFQSMRDEMNERFESLEAEMHDGFRTVNTKIERISRIDEYQDSEVFELKGRVKVLEKKLGVKMVKPSGK